MTPDQSRRQYVRVNVDIPVEFRVEGDAAPHYGTACDLGAGGMRLVSPADIPARTNLTLQFRLRAAEREIHARGHVVLSFLNRAQQAYHHGVAFTALAADDKEAISDFVRVLELTKNV